ncbi:MAG: hypothetical protein V8S92_05310 [Oscillospiraceae bacterium]
MGAPIAKLICASNRNDVLTEFLRTGVYDRNRPFYPTMSPSMDILISSNLERLLALMEGAGENVADYMNALAAHGKYTVKPETAQKIATEFACGFCGDEDTEKTIAQLFAEQGYSSPTPTRRLHGTSPGSTAQKAESDRPLVVVSTASPFKFCKSVLEALGETSFAAGTDIIAQLAQQTRKARTRAAGRSCRKSRALYRCDRKRRDDAGRDGVSARMSLYAIGDLHLCLGAYKPMDVFGGRWRVMENLRGAFRDCAGRHDRAARRPQSGARHRAGRKGLCLPPPNSGQENHSQGKPRLLVDDGNKIHHFCAARGWDDMFHPEQQLLFLRRDSALRHPRLVLRAGAGGHAR